jgi:arsenate reductase-like glutaredoxin family protein
MSLCNWPFKSENLRLSQHGAKNVVTLFHKPSVPASTRVHTILKQANAHAVSDIKGDQAEKNEFELDVTEAPPTADQLKNILEYLGGPTSATVGKLIRGANDQADALKRLEKDGDAFQRPVVSPYGIFDIHHCVLT